MTDTTNKVPALNRRALLHRALAGAAGAAIAATTALLGPLLVVCSGGRCRATHQRVPKLGILLRVRTELAPLIDQQPGIKLAQLGAEEVLGDLPHAGALPASAYRARRRPARRGFLLTKTWPKEDNGPH
jgi:hypothetical protein